MFMIRHLTRKNHIGNTTHGYFINIGEKGKRIIILASDDDPLPFSFQTDIIIIEHNVVKLSELSSRL